MARTPTQKGAKPRAKSKRTASKEEGSPSNAFTEAVKFALGHIGDSAYLGAHSPLAAPYFLDTALEGQPDADTPAGRGRKLGVLLARAIDALDAPLRELLTLYYLDAEYSRKKNRAVAISHKLFRSRPVLMRELREGLSAVAHHLGQNAQPPLRAEWPAGRSVIGRRSIINPAMAALRQTQPVALTGHSGMGKTSVGYALAEEWGRSHVLWFTLRPELNDRLLSLVLTLGYFLRGLGAGHTWSQLVAEDGKLSDDALISGLIRKDLAELQALGIAPLICVDELEVLRLELQEHTRIKHFVEGLCGSAALVLMGQRVVIDQVNPHQVYALEGFSLEDLTDLLAQEGVFYLSDEEKAHLLRATRGTPALIRMFAVLYRSGEGVREVLGRVGTEVSAEAMLTRIWNKLPSEERRLLGGLSVFRDAAPRDAWSQAGAQDTIDALRRRGLIEDDGRGGIAVAAYAREFVLRQLSADGHQQAHLAAALVREERGQYTFAASHYIAAKNPTLALRLWVPRRREERTRGHGPLATSLFRAVLPAELKTDEDRRALALVLAELHYATGDGEAMREALNGAIWPEKHPLTPIASGLVGDAFALQNYVEEATAAYLAGLRALEQPVATISVNLHRQLGYLHHRNDGASKSARLHALQAMSEAEVFMGFVEEQAGNYPEAQQHYEAALNATQQGFKIPRQQCDCYSSLGRLAMYQGQLEDALNHLDAAISLAKQMGHMTLMASDQITLSGVYILMKRFDEALKTALDGLQTCKAFSIQAANILVGLNVNAGEAYYNLGDYDNAIAYGLQAYQTEERIGIPYAMTVIGMAYHTKGDVERAEPALTDAIALATQIGDQYAEAAALRELGRLHRTLNRPNEAHHTLTRSHEIYVRLGNAMEAEVVSKLLNAPS
jgi:tetratricopeptide (TPR) repeat protein